MTNCRYPNRFVVAFIGCLAVCGCATFDQIVDESINDPELADAVKGISRSVDEHLGGYVVKKIAGSSGEKKKDTDSDDLEDEEDAHALEELLRSIGSNR